MKTKAQDRIRLPDGREMTAAAALDAGLLKLVESRYYDPPRYFLRSVGDEVSWEIGKTFYQSRTGGKLPFKGAKSRTVIMARKRTRKSPEQCGAELDAALRAWGAAIDRADFDTAKVQLRRINTLQRSAACRRWAASVKFPR